MIIPGPEISLQAEQAIVTQYMGILAVMIKHVHGD
jgi:hypothetical protein